MQRCKKLGELLAAWEDKPIVLTIVKAEKKSFTDTINPSDDQPEALLTAI